MTTRRLIRASVFVCLSGIFFASLAFGQSRDPVSIKFWSINFSGGAGTDPLKEIIRDFEQANPTIKIDLQVRSTDAHKEAMRLAINTEDAPDVYWMWCGKGLGGFYINGAEPLSQYYETYGWNQRFVRPALELAYFNDQLYGVPLQIYDLAVFYRKDLFAKAGITTPPATYEQLIEANDKLVKAGLTPLSMGGKFGWMTMRLVDQLLERVCGAKTHDALKSLQADWSQEPAVAKAYTELKLWAERYLPHNYLGVEPTEGIIPVYRGQAAMQYEGGWLIPRLIADGQDLSNWGFFPFPTETGRIYFFSEELFITKRSRHKAEAAKFIDFWTSPEMQQKYVAAFGGASPALGVEFKQGPPLQQNFYSLITNTKGTFLPADMAMPLPVVQAYFKANDQVVSGEVDPARAGQIVQDAIEKYQKEKR